MTARRTALAAALVSLTTASAAHAFCGFYVSRQDGPLYNKASQVVLARDGFRTVVTMASDYAGDASEFAIVIPSPVPLKKEDVSIAEASTVAHIDQWTQPRLAEYFDPPVCPNERAKRDAEDKAREEMAMKFASLAAAPPRPKEAVRILERYTVGEYDILILEADESRALETWLRTNGYRIPNGAADVLGSYIAQNMKFFVAKVNLGEQARLGVTKLRPIRISYESPRFMLPVRLGMVNAQGPQDLLVYALTRHGRVETTNYRTVKLPTDVDVPERVASGFPEFASAVFEKVWKDEGRAVAVTEFAWELAPYASTCDPCSAQDFTPDELRRLGVTWELSRADGRQPVVVTRLHFRYDLATFPEDLVFQETADRATYQGRYVLHHPWRGENTCDAAGPYRETVKRRHETELANLARLTDWTPDDIRTRFADPWILAAPTPTPAPTPPPIWKQKSWWQRIFSD